MRTCLLAICVLLLTVISHTAKADEIPYLEVDCYDTTSGFYSPPQAHCQPTLHGAIQYLLGWIGLHEACEVTPYTASDGTIAWRVKLISEGEVCAEVPGFNTTFYRLALRWCPDGYNLNSYETVCIGPGHDTERHFVTPNNIVPDANPCPAEGNPCNPITGNKTQREVDYQGEGANALAFTRYYNHQAASPFEDMGARWSHNYVRHIEKVKEHLFQPHDPTHHSALYETRQAACETGWQDIKNTVTQFDTAQSIAVWEDFNCVIKTHDRAQATLKVSTRDTDSGIPSFRTMAWDLFRPNGQRIRFRQNEQTGQWYAPAKPGAQFTYHSEM